MNGHALVRIGCSAALSGEEATHGHYMVEAVRLAVRQACERNYVAAQAALESLISARGPELPPVPVPLAPARARPILAWACVGGLLAVFVLAR